MKPETRQNSSFLAAFPFCTNELEAKELHKNTISYNICVTK